MLQESDSLADRLGDPLNIAALKARYAAGRLRPAGLVAGILERIARRGKDPTWIHLVPRAELEARAAELERRAPADLPLYGIPFAIKDNIDCRGASHHRRVPGFRLSAEASAAGGRAAARRRARSWSARPISTSSPPAWSACARPTACPRNTFNPAYIPGGSSSGSAVAVAAGLVSFASAPIPRGRAACRRRSTTWSGLKPTRGLLSARGVVPACRSLDCVSIFGLTAARRRRGAARARKASTPADPFSRRAAPPPRALPRSFAGLRFGVPRDDQLEFFGNRETPQLFQDFVKKLSETGCGAGRASTSRRSWRPRGCSMKDRGWRSGMWRSASSSSATPRRCTRSPRDHPGRDSLLGGRRLLRVLPPAGAAAPDRSGLGRDRHPGHADRRAPSTASPS